MSAATASLLARVRARERQRAEEHMAGQSPEQLRRALMLGRLPGLVDAIAL
jgi:hypothetical protein